MTDENEITLESVSKQITGINTRFNSLILAIEQMTGKKIDLLGSNICDSIDELKDAVENQEASNIPEPPTHLNITARFKTLLDELTDDLVEPADAANAAFEAIVGNFFVRGTPQQYKQWAKTKLEQLTETVK